MDQDAPNYRSDLASELQKIHDSKINLRISWSDGGITLRLGDESKGFVAEENVSSVSDIVEWLQDAIAHFYPDSTYALSLPAELRERAASRLFHPPHIGVRLICPHCGAANVWQVLEESRTFVCAHCGASVKCEPPRVQ